MLLECCTWPEIDAYLERSRGVILPIGSTEQHGPTGLIGTDTICAEAVARAVGDETEALVAPTLSFGMAQHHLAFAGTMTLRPETLLGVLVDLLASLSRHGFERCFVINGHGGNMATAMAAFSEIHARSSLNRDPTAGRLRCRLRNWWSPPAVMALQKELFGERDGSHATASEISLTWHARPDVARKTELQPPLAPASRGFTDADDFRARYPDGRIGSDPSTASASAGERLLRAAAQGLAEEYRRFLEAD
ncbi:MAG: creatininase family protein [Geminicoccaceae bacterium]|nr:creatininase family protein [Geminicoccaceae bacterium]